MVICPLLFLKGLISQEHSRVHTHTHNFGFFILRFSYLAGFLVEIAIAVGVAAETPRARAED